MTRHTPMRWLTLFTAAAGLLAASLSLGCTRDIPRSDHSHGPLPHQFRRAPDYNSETLFSHVDRDDYEPIRGLNEARLTEDQRLAVQEFGAPDHRRTFRSFEGENVLEWLDIDDNLAFQFVRGELVFQGPIRDLEHTILRHGIPNDVIYSLTTTNIERVTFIYERVFTPDHMVFSFANGHLVYEDRYH